jgi:hypothetical protein
MSIVNKMSGERHVNPRPTERRRPGRTVARHCTISSIESGRACSCPVRQRIFRVMGCHERSPGTRSLHVSGHQEANDGAGGRGHDLAGGAMGARCARA